MCNIAFVYSPLRRVTNEIAICKCYGQSDLSVRIMWILIGQLHSKKDFDWTITCKDELSIEVFVVHLWNNYCRLFIRKRRHLENNSRFLWKMMQNKFSREILKFAVSSNCLHHSSNCVLICGIFSVIPEMHSSICQYSMLRICIWLHNSSILTQLKQYN